MELEVMGLVLWKIEVQSWLPLPVNMVKLLDFLETASSLIRENLVIY